MERIAYASIDANDGQLSGRIRANSNGQDWGAKLTSLPFDTLQRSGAALGNTNYHFPYKEKLFAEVVSRRFDFLFAMVRYSLDGSEQGNDLDLVKASSAPSCALALTTAARSATTLS